MHSPMYTGIWFIPGWLFFIVITFAAVYSFAAIINRRYKLVMAGQPVNRVDQPGRRFGRMFKLVFGQTSLLREAFTGLSHAMVFYGFVILIIANVFLLSDAFFPVFGTALEKSTLYGIFQFLIEFIILLVYVGLVMLAWRTYVIRPERLTIGLDGLKIILMIFAVVTLALMMDIFRYAMIDSPIEKWAFIGGPVGNAIARWPQATLYSSYVVSFWLHLIIILYFLIYLPGSKHAHLYICPFNEFFQKLGPRGIGSFINMDEAEEFGTERIEQFHWKHLLDLLCCVECGRCQEGCPAHASGKPLSPKKLILDMKQYLISLEKPLIDDGKTPEGAVPMVGDTIAEDVIWSCTTCGYCEEHCPFAIEHIEKMTEMRRYMVLMSNQYPKEFNKFFKNMEVHGNPWEIGWQKRADWTAGLDVPVAAEVGKFDVLYWVGCLGAFDDSGKKTSRAMVSLLKKAGVNFAILGTEERCTGDSARKIGNEMLFQTLAGMNIETMNGYGVKKIVTHCPHCYHTLKYEYPQLGGNYEVVHHSEFLLDLVKQGELKINGKSATVNSLTPGKSTIHDSCYLGRYNKIYDPPRELMKLAGVDIVEMKKHGEKSFCCGAGGGGMWLEETIGERINKLRSQQAAETGASQLISACPFCTVMFRDGLADIGKQEEIKALDIAEVLDGVT